MSEKNMPEMKIQVLIDNREHEDLTGEWGLSVYIEYHGKKILLDAGTTGSFADNAQKMGIDLAEIDFAVLSHAHYDHADGFDRFFERNQKAKLYLRSACCENCYSQHSDGKAYIGIRRGMLSRYSDRLAYVDGDYELMPGVTLMPHKNPDIEQEGIRAKMFTLEDGIFRYERFRHEQSLIFHTKQGLVVFNSCSHGGAANIVRDVQSTWPEEKIYAYVGGMHLFRTPEEKVKALGESLQSLDIGRILTGHCTGDEAFQILKEILGDRVTGMYSGLTLTI